MLRCNVGILFDIENVTEVASASEVHFNVFFFFFCFFGSAFDSFLSHQKIKVWDKESPKLLLGQCAWKDILGKMMARKQLSKSDFEHS